jgi:two-component system, LytTR family, sensor kinase
MQRPRWQIALVILLVWVALVLFDGSSTFLSYSYSPQNQISFPTALLYALVEWSTWALLAVPTVLVASRVSLEKGYRIKATVTLLLLGVFIAWARVWLQGVASQLAFGGQPAPLQLRVVRQWPANFLTYFVLLLGYFAVRYYGMYRERELRATQLEAGLAQARLDALRMQLHPHFLFNTLNSVSTLMHRDVEAADDMLAALSDLLRVALERGADQEVSLKEELDLLRRYLDIEQIRFGDRLRVTLAIEPDCLDARVPNLILQPLAENAIRHGLDPRPEPGHLQISAHRAQDKLILRVSDDGPGVTTGTPINEGVGLSNTRARLQQLYGNPEALHLHSAPGGFTVTVTVPFHSTEHDRPDRR